MQLCEYGCGKEAIYQLKNGKWCCEQNFQSCISFKLKISKTIKGRKHSQETRIKISKSLMNHKVSEQTINKIKEKLIGFKHSENTRLILSEQRKGVNNGMYGKTHSKEVREKIRQKRYLTIEYLNKKYTIFSKIEEMRYNPDKIGEIQVHCKNHTCPNSKENGGWFTPTKGQISERVTQLEHEKGNGGSYFYCSDHCKQECPLYGMNPLFIINQDNNTKYYTEREYYIWRQEVLKRANNQCQYCGKPAEHCHHIQPKKLEPIYILDPDNGIACCEECHFKYGHQTGTECSTGNLAYKICKQGVK